jgi:hypothetical protein
MLSWLLVLAPPIYPSALGWLYVHVLSGRLPSPRNDHDSDHMFQPVTTQLQLPLFRSLACGVGDVKTDGACLSVAMYLA